MVPATFAAELAARYDAHLAAYWRGDELPAATFAAWLEAHRRPAIPNHVNARMR